MSGAPPVLHATALALWWKGGWRGVLLRGRSGAGKSDLALRALAAGWRLVADDRVVAWASGGRLYARAPAALEGLVEARGLGVERVSHLPMAEVALVVDLADTPEGLERVPERDSAVVAGIRVRRIALFGLESSAVHKLSLALQAATLGAGADRAYQTPLANAAKAPGANAGASQEE